MKFHSRQTFFLGPGKEKNFSISWNWNGIPTWPGGAGDKGPLYMTAFPYHKIGEGGVRRNVFDAKLTTLHNSVIFNSPTKNRIQWFKYTVRVRNDGPKGVWFKITGSSVGEKI